MAYIAVTYSFSNSTTSDGTQVNTNYTDIINGLSDGTKDLNMNAATFAGNVTMNGNIALGNAAGDTINPSGTWNNHIIPNVTNTYDLGTIALGWRAFYFMGNTKYLKLLASGAQSADWTFTFPVTAGTAGYFLKTDGAGVTSWSAFTPPTVQILTSASANYTTPANVKYIHVKMVGSGGSGGGGGTGSWTAGTAGNSTTFCGNTAGGGAAANTPASSGGAGGTTTFVAGTLILAVNGTAGGGTWGGMTGAVPYLLSGAGGGTPMGAGGAQSAGAGTAGAAYTGGGGAGGYGGTGVTAYCGSGGGGGGYLEFIFVPTALQVLAYVNGASVAGSAAGTGAAAAAGGASGSGSISVTEYYS